MFGVQLTWMEGNVSVWSLENSTMISIPASI